MTEIKPPRGHVSVKTSLHEASSQPMSVSHSSTGGCVSIVVATDEVDEDEVVLGSVVVVVRGRRRVVVVVGRVVGRVVVVDDAAKSPKASVQPWATTVFASRQSCSRRAICRGVENEQSKMERGCV